MCTSRVITVGVVVVGAFAGGPRAAGDDQQDRVPLAAYPLPANTTFERYEVGGNAAAATPTAERLVYSNTLGTRAAPLGANNLLADDIAITGPNGCKLRRYEFPVFGKFDPNGVGGPYTVSYALYTNCPGSVPSGSRAGLIITGTQGQAVFSDDGPRLISVVVPEGGNVALRTNMWLGVMVSRENAGVVMGAPALVGFSADQFDFPGSPCSNDFGGFPNDPQGSMNLEIYADAECAEAFVGYKDNKPSGSPFNPGANVTFADDIQLGVNGCQMVAYEVAVKGPASYTLDLRNNCEGPAIPGTERSVIISSGTDVKIARFPFDPPIPLPQNLWFSAKVNNPTGGVVVAGRQACIGQTANYIGILGQNGCELFDPFPFSIHAAFSLAITCAGPPPVGACCDMVLTDEHNEPVCREVPQMNCPWPWPQYTSTLQPQWVGGASCNPDPFPFPCGAAACCRPDDVCENLTVDHCNAVAPLEAPRVWQHGAYCGWGEQTCPFQACLVGEGDCAVPHHGPGCGDPDCCDAVCRIDRYCCVVDWDRACVELGGGCGGGHDECWDADPMVGALPVSADSITVFSNLRATSGADPEFCCRSGPAGEVYGTMWFKFTATDSSASISLCGSDPALDSLVNILAVGDSTTEQTACSTLISVACGDDSEECGFGRHAQFCVKDLVPGHTYYVVVASKYSFPRGMHQLEIQSPCFSQPFWIPEDCNENGLADGCDLGKGAASDCNKNSILDECDLAAGTSLDCDANMFPDECTGAIQTLRPLVPEAYAQFGHSMDMIGDRLVIGFNGAKALYFFRRNLAGWELDKTAYVPDYPPSYMDMDGDWIVTTNDQHSTAVLFRGNGTFAGTLQGPDVLACPRFGSPVAISGDTIALGKGFCQYEAALPEEVFVFRRQDSNWLEEARIQAPDTSEATSFGAAVHLEGDRLLVGAPRGHPGEGGAAYVFRHVNGAWVHEGTLTASDGREGTFFGRSAILHGEFAFVGATWGEAVYVFRRSGSSWSQHAKLTASGYSNFFGWSLRASGNTLLVTSEYVYDWSVYLGEVHIFGRHGDTWLEGGTIGPWDADELARDFGQGLAIDGSLIAIGAPGTGSQDLYGIGAAYLFQRPQGDCNGNGIPDLCDVRDATSADCNADGVPDECEVLRPSDYDFDGDVDLIDLAGFQRCFTGPGSATLAPCCRMFDGESDGDVDGADFVAFNRAFAGP